MSSWDLCPDCMNDRDTCECGQDDIPLPGSRSDAIPFSTASADGAARQGLTIDHGERCDCPVCRDRYRQGKSLENYDFASTSATLCVLFVGALLFALAVVGAIHILK